MSNQDKIAYQPSVTLQIRHTGNILGNLQDLPRLGTVIRNERQAHPDMLLFDTGNFSGNNVPGPHKGLPHVEVMNLLKYDALVPGRAEVMDSAALRQMARKARFPFLASNWFGWGEGNYYQRFLKIERAGLSILVLGMAWPEAPQDTESMDPQTALKQALKNDKDANSVIVILSQLGYMADRALAMSDNRPKVILSGVPTPGFEQQAMVGSSLLVPVSKGAQTLGTVTLTLSGKLDIMGKKSTN